MSSAFCRNKNCVVATERTLDMERLQREAVSLREQIQEEQRRRSSRVLDLQEQLRGIEGYQKMSGIFKKEEMGGYS